MNPESISAPKLLRGAVLLLGSLLWEGEKPEQDGQKGKDRKSWRVSCLDMNTLRTVSGLPICYGRRSASRSGQFTMVFGGSPSGTAQIADLKLGLPVENSGAGEISIAALKREVESLASAEGIWTASNKAHWSAWGLVAIAINPDSAFADKIREVWKAHFKPAPPFQSATYGAAMVDEHGILNVPLPWKTDALVGVDFCLSTPTKPDPVLPTAKQIAEAIQLGSYFERTFSSGIITPDDADILRFLRT